MLRLEKNEFSIMRVEDIVLGKIDKTVQRRQLASSQEFSEKKTSLKAEIILPYRAWNLQYALYQIANDDMGLPVRRISYQDEVGEYKDIQGWDISQMSGYQIENLCSDIESNFDPNNEAMLNVDFGTIYKSNIRLQLIPGDGMIVGYSMQIGRKALDKLRWHNSSLPVGFVQALYQN